MDDRDNRASDSAVPGMLAGPRGRRLCLALAGRLSPDVSQAQFWLAYELDPGRGTSRGVMYFADGASANEPERAVMSVPEFAELIRESGIPPLRASDVNEALRDSVDSARYWQEPDGEDVLAAQPEVRAALEPIARAVQANVASEDWGATAATTQWRIAWENARPRGLPTSDLLKEWADATRADEVRSRTDRPTDPRARYSGEWWSTPGAVPNTSGVIPRGLDLVEDSSGWEAATVRPLEVDGRRTLEIRTAENWAGLCRAHPLDVTASRRHDWFRATGRDGSWVMPDWQAVSAEWDAVHLSVAAYLALAGRLIDVDGEERASVIAGWSPDTTWWLTEPPTSDAPPQNWHRADPQAPWSRRP